MNNNKLLYNIKKIASMKKEAANPIKLLQNVLASVKLPNNLRSKLLKSGIAKGKIFGDVKPLTKDQLAKNTKKSVQALRESQLSNLIKNDPKNTWRIGESLDDIDDLIKRHITNGGTLYSPGVGLEELLKTRDALIRHGQTGTKAWSKGFRDNLEDILSTKNTNLNKDTAGVYELAKRLNKYNPNW